MTTIRRTLRLKFNEILDAYLKSSQNYLGEEMPEEILEKLADAALGVLLPKESPSFMTKAGIEWQILAGVPVEQSQIDAEKLTKEVIDAFESAFGIERPWNWYPDKPSEARVWAEFREYLTKLYVSDHDCFTRYFTWAAQPFSRGAMSTLGIKRNPQDFPDSFAAFCASAMYQKPRKVVPDNERTDLDAGGTPMSYG